MTEPNQPSAGDGDRPVRVEHEYDAETPPSIAIVQAIAAIEGIDPMNSPAALGITLYDHVDTEALDRLVTDDSVGAITIDLAIETERRYAVRVRTNGRLVVQRIEQSVERVE
ncbi:HalOD1 output domain-containing protein [Halopiger djelfimassiliensis]|uniref:HalOD1 output domain-containing protein n=1 Tax=Halopiger djelfimassiliensis TaxID=1293047 RepID=UPI0006776B2F|nr:HalOD1 output domain-containing protein [Halopiger djelfimassiliensis]